MSRPMGGLLIPGVLVPWAVAGSSFSARIDGRVAAEQIDSGRAPPRSLAVPSSGGSSGQAALFVLWFRCVRGQVKVSICGQLKSPPSRDARNWQVVLCSSIRSGPV